jgi:glycosyltransferase involved in cell wall biosynthesis
MKSPILGTKLELIPNGINLPAIPVLTPSSCRGFTLFYISRLDHRHAQLIKFILSEVWPEVVKRNPDALFHLIGDGSGLRQIQDFHQSKRFSPYRETVKFKGYCRQVPINYPNADLVLGVGRVAIESMIYGIPVLSVKYNHLGKIIIRENFRELMFSNFVDLKAEAPSKKEMVDALFDFIDRKEYYSNEARLLQHAAIQEFNQVEIVKRIVGVYQQTLA